MAEKIFAIKHGVTAQDLLSYCFSDEEGPATVFSEFFVKKSVKFRIRDNELEPRSHMSHCKSKGLPEDTMYYDLLPIGKLPVHTHWRYFAIPIKFLLEWS